MGVRPRTLFDMTKVRKEYRANLPDIECRIAKMTAIINLRPRIKTYIDTLPTREEIEQVKQSREYDAVMVLFDPLSGNCTTPKEIVMHHPLLDFYNGTIPSAQVLKEKTRNPTCDGLLISFRRLNAEEKEKVSQISGMNFET